MLAIRERVRPWRARWRVCSVGRLTVIRPSSTLITISGCTSSSSWPRPPLTVMWVPLKSISTPSGTGIGSLPMRDIRSPDVADDLSAQAFFEGLPAAHEAMRSGKNYSAEPAEHAGDLGLTSIDTQAGTADPLETVDRTTTLLPRLQLALQPVPPPVLPT